MSAHLAEDLDNAISSAFIRYMANATEEEPFQPVDDSVYPARVKRLVRELMLDAYALASCQRGSSADQKLRASLRSKLRLLEATVARSEQSPPPERDSRKR